MLDRPIVPHHEMLRFFNFQNGGYPKCWISETEIFLQPCTFLVINTYWLTTYVAAALAASSWVTSHVTTTHLATSGNNTTTHLAASSNDVSCQHRNCIAVARLLQPTQPINATVTQKFPEVINLLPQTSQCSSKRTGRSKTLQEKVLKTVSSSDQREQYIRSCKTWPSLKNGMKTRRPRALKLWQICSTIPETLKTFLQLFDVEVSHWFAYH